MFACLSRQGETTGRSTGPERKVVIRTDRIDAVIFDMDGVVTDTARVHAAAWARLFDGFLGDRAAITGEAFRPFTVDDYRRFVDGKPRYAGVRSFLASRGITLPEGDPSDPPDRQTVCGLGNRKDGYFLEHLREHGIAAFPTTVALLEELGAAGVRTAVISASRNLDEVLAAGHVQHLFGLRLGGMEADRLGLAGKPDPAVFLEAPGVCGCSLAARPSLRTRWPASEPGAGAVSARHRCRSLGSRRRAPRCRRRGVVRDLADVRLEVVPDADGPPRGRERGWGAAGPNGGLGLNGWVLVYEGFDPGAEGPREALCTLGNGRFATRGAVPEARADDVHYPGTYAAGVYNRLKTAVGEREVENEDLVNLPNWLPLSFRIEGGAWFDVRTAELLGYRQELDSEAASSRVRSGSATAMRFESTVTQRRFVHMEDARVAGLQTTIVAENWAGRLDVRSELDGAVVNSGVARYRDLANRHLRLVDQGSVDDECVRMVVETTQSHVRVALAARTRASVNGEPTGAEIHLVEEDGRIGHELSIELARGDAATVEKVVTMFTSKDHATSDPGYEAGAWVVRADSFGQLHERHRLAWDRLWGRFEITISGSERTQLLLRLHVFHLLQTVSPHSIDLDVGVPARGLHGEAYRGHVFWDELFVFPLLNYRLPILTRSLLEYRHRRLREARWAARERGYRGASFPWQSGSDGREETQRFHLNPGPDAGSPITRVSSGTSTWRSRTTSGSTSRSQVISPSSATTGPRSIVEIARFFSSLATYRPAGERYDILGVLGPDEYHDAYPGRGEPGLDNNAYTNVMTTWLMCRALETMEVLPLHLRRELKDELRVTEEEMGRWEDLSRRIFVPFHDGVISQFEGYEDLEELDWQDYRSRYGDIGRLDRILEAEGDTPNRYRLSKQADVLMLFYLLSPEELSELFGRLGYAFDPGRDIDHNVEYYLARTSDGSTLSGVVHAWVLARLDRGQSWDHLKNALESDVADIQGGTTREGIHLGAMAGTVDIVQRAYMGLVVRDDCLWFDPALPEELVSLDTELHYRDHRIRVEVRHGVLRLTTRPGRAAPIRVGFRNIVVELRPGTVTEWSLDQASS